jgi:5-methylthioadenosine/S-adenosylhomocysteine deaminase
MANSKSVKTAKQKPPIDPAESPQIALAGQIVTMDDSGTVLKHGVVFMEGGCIKAVQESGQAPPSGFESTTIVDSGGTVFPGLIELHNHLSYNILKLWDVPKAYGNRGQWAGIPEYRQLISGPMKKIGGTPGLLAALVRWVEGKCLVSGTTTSQGIALFSNAGVRRFYRGIVRNVEQTNDPDLPEAGTRIPDIDAKDAKSFLARLAQKKCFLLHLAEGVDETARKHFLSLEFKPGEWAIAESLAGIHCTGLKADDFDVMAGKGASMVWSPLSNLLLYGGTADIASAKKSGVRIGLGSDWSPSGSKNLLGELKVAHLYSQAHGGILSDQEIVALATRNAASILGWDKFLGSIEPGKQADLLVVDGRPKDAYGALIKAKENSVRLVVINGIPRYGTPDLMTDLGAGKVESLTIGREKRALYLEQKNEDPDVAAISLRSAKTILSQALEDLPRAAKFAKAVPARLKRALEKQPLTWQLALDELGPTGLDVRPHLPLDGHATMVAAKGALAAAAKPVTLKSLQLDPLTVVDDDGFLDLITRERNLPDFVKKDLPGYY